MTIDPATQPPRAGHSDDGSIKETLISLIISFVMALVFRSYVVEAFIIPTGSMAPTLLGAHMRFQSEQTGLSWTVNPWYHAPDENPTPIQGQGQYGAPSATDPMTTSRVNPIRPGGRSGVPLNGHVAQPRPVPVRAGDRILVEKYLYNVFPPERFDVVVFKNPELATQNFIKRLIGLPNEQVWIADGDVFTRPIDVAADGSHAVNGSWRIARKPDRVQEAVWWPIFSSEYAPLHPERDGRRWFSTPWKGEGWATEDRRDYRRDSDDPGTLLWDTAVWPITNWVPYNEFPMKMLDLRGLQLFPVADLRMRAAIRPDRTGAAATATIAALGHEFQAALGPGEAALRMRPVAHASAEGAPWTTLASTAFEGLPAGRATNVEFWHADQALQLRVNGRVLLRAHYDWGPSERLLHATGTPGQDFTETTPAANRLRLAETYRGTRPAVRWHFRGSPITLFRVGLDRDLYYEASQFARAPYSPALGTHPLHLVSLGPDQFFVLGDNSPSSKDGRLWEEVDPWVADQIDGTVGVVPRKLLLGKAFFVYFPAPYRAFGRVPVPDFGRMRFIR